MLLYVTFSTGLYYTGYYICVTYESYIYKPFELVIWVKLSTPKRQQKALNITKNANIVKLPDLLRTQIKEMKIKMTELTPQEQMKIMSLKLDNLTEILGKTGNEEHLDLEDFKHKTSCKGCAEKAQTILDEYEEDEDDDE